MRILHVIPSIDKACGGPVEGLRQFCGVYRIGGHEVDVASLDPPEFARKCGFPANVIGLGADPRRYGFTRHALPWLKANRSRYDVVVIDCLWQYNAVAAYWALSGSGIPYAIFPHGMLDPYFKRTFPLKHLKKTIYWHVILERILRNATAVFFTCEEERILARQSFSPYRVREMLTPFGIFGPDCDLSAAAEEFLCRWPHLRGKRLALFLGRIHPKKAIDVLIEAFHREFAKDPAWHLVIAGPDLEGWKSELEVLAAKLGISDRITWPEMLSGTLKWGSFAASEIFVLPSHQENFGVVVAESLACGLPVIISDKVNIWREIASYEAGIVGEDTVEGTRASLQRWAKLTSEEIAEFRLRSRKCFQEQFDYKVNSGKVLENIEYVAMQSRQK
jgi:glycosyltransferase involved in cell wall biosynthesis